MSGAVHPPPTGPSAACTIPAAALDRPTRWTTFATVVLLVLGVPVILAWGEQEPALLWAGLAVGLAVTVLAWACAPAAYEVGEGELVVRRRLLGRKRFALTGRCAELDWRVGFGSLRLFGSGGAFGWYGLFWRAGVGRYRAYVTDRARLVGCQTASGLVVVSPAEPERLVAAVAGAAGQARAAP